MRKSFFYICLFFFVFCVGFVPACPITFCQAQTQTEIWDVSAFDISAVDQNRKLISFTFDDAPSTQLKNILAVFNEYNEENPDCKATATFFCNSMLFNRNNREILKNAVQKGFELGNHTHSHLDLTSLSEQEVKEEIDKTDKYLQNIDGKSRHLLRAPFGKTDEFVKSLSPAPLIDWTIDTLDWTNRKDDEIYNQIFSNLGNGNIVLMHDGYEHTVSALKRLLPDLKAIGYQVVSVSQLAKAHSCSLKSGEIYIRARNGRK